MAHPWPWQRAHAACVVPCGVACAAIELPPQPLFTVPILAAGALALAIAVAKLAALSRVPIAGPERVDAYLASLGTADDRAAQPAADALPGPVGELLALGLHDRDGTAARVEARLAERREWMLRRLQRSASFVAWVAAVAPLLGLLGTLVGFARSLAFTVFDVGDPGALAAGPGSAVVCLQYGIVAAAPSWLVYCVLARRVRRIAVALDAASAALLAWQARLPKAPQ